MPLIGRTNAHARHLRRDATDAERRLWYYLRNRQLEGFKFRRQVTIDRFVADFACVECKLIIEADGGQHCDDVDRERTALLAALGWRVLRFWNNEVLTNTDGVLEAILTECEGRQREKTLTGSTSSSRPLPPAGEV